MNKQDLIKKTAEKASMSQVDTKAIINALFDVITEVLPDEDVKVTNFGTFTVIDKAARTCRNPQTGAIVEVPACKAPKFKPSSALKEIVNA